MRKIEERLETEHVTTEWEPSTRVDVRTMSDRDVRAWVRAANATAKRDGDYTRFRSIADDTGEWM